MMDLSKAIECPPILVPLVPYDCNDDTSEEEGDSDPAKHFVSSETESNRNVTNFKFPVTNLNQGTSSDLSHSKLQGTSFCTIPNDSFIRKPQEKCEPLPLPPAVLGMFSVPSSEQNENPEEHGGKIRSFPHEEGIWATYVFIEYIPNPAFYELIDGMIKVAENHGIYLTRAEDFHISLSRTLKLRHLWIHPFVESLKTQLVHYNRFKLMFQSVEAYNNDQSTRSFLGLKVHLGVQHLLKLVKRIDTILEEFKQPIFYENPSFHLSLAWCVGDVTDKIQEIMPELEVAFQYFLKEHLSCRTMWVTKINCKSGNKLFSLSLKTSEIPCK